MTHKQAQLWLMAERLKLLLENRADCRNLGGRARSYTHTLWDNRKRAEQCRPQLAFVRRKRDS